MLTPRRRCLHAPGVCAERLKCECASVHVAVPSNGKLVFKADAGTEEAAVGEAGGSSGDVSRSFRNSRALAIWNAACAASSTSSRDTCEVFGDRLLSSITLYTIFGRRIRKTAPLNFHREETESQRCYLTSFSGFSPLPW